MTKLITVLIIAAALFVGWHLFLYWEKVKNEEESSRKQAAAAAVSPEQLPGLPQALESSLQAAQREGVNSFRTWLKTYGNSLQDPRKAWIELDFCLALSRENPAEAKKIFAAVKERTSPASPVWPRIQALEKTYE